jgi:hypothetical protein
MWLYDVLKVCAVAVLGYGAIHEILVVESYMYIVYITPIVCRCQVLGTFPGEMCPTLC